MPLRKDSSSALVYGLKITLKNSKPPIWRKIETADGTLASLHDALQIVMGWTDSHLHQFVVDGERYGALDPDFVSEMIDEREVRLSQIIIAKGDRFIYEYDFGDGWLHEIKVETVLPPRADKQYPTCTGGRRACPPEDCGGIGGYHRFLQAIQDPNDATREEMLDWAGGSFDSEAFDLEAVNRSLKMLKWRR